VGGATPSGSGSGITFPATQSASTDANTLDDYEEGTFTPSAGAQISGTGLTFSGKYTKIGNIVNTQILVTGTSIATTGGGTLMSGLPFTVSSSAGGISLGSYADQANSSWRGTFYYSTSIYSCSTSTSGGSSLFFSGQYFTT
jgi:hypothetical protein